MPSDFEQLIPQLANNLIDSNIAFTGAFAENVRKEIGEGIALEGWKNFLSTRGWLNGERQREYGQQRSF